MVSPMTCSPARCSMPATTELSTPPDIATAIGRLTQAYAGASFLRCATHSTTASISASTCSAVFDRPSEKRTLDRACSLRQADRRQHVRRLGRAARARRAARHRESLEIERDQQRLAVDSVEADIRSVGRPRRARAVDVRVRQRDRESPAPADRAKLVRRAASAAPCIDNPLAPRVPAPPRPRHSPSPRAARAHADRRTASARSFVPLRTYSAPSPSAHKSCAR